MGKNILQDSRTDLTITLNDAIITSQPISGGLWSITDFPLVKLNELKNLSGSSYQELAYHILSKFDFGISSEDLKQIIWNSYGNQWHKKEITPVKQIGNTNLYSLHLGYGPTFAFKNIALEFLPRLLTKLAKGKTLNVIGVSSGDTINAAHSGVKGTNINSIFMLPNVGPSEVQALQAVNGIVNNDNAFTLLVNKSFDPLQDIVKRINGPEFIDFKTENNITSFNSINIARILAQVVYYFRAYTQLLNNKKISNGDEIIFSVPSGNFGDALAGYYAKKMGLPISKIHVATNENDMLDKFFKTGIYEPPKNDGIIYVQVTNAPSMDIAKSSNFERMLFDIYSFDSVKIKSLYDELKLTGKFQVNKKILTQIQKTFISSFSTDEERLNIIREFGEKYQHGIDPHTAAAVVPWNKGEHNLKGDTPVVFLETSHVAQFSAELKNKGIIVPGMNEFDESLNIMKNSKPIEGKNFLKISGNFDDTFPIIKKVITEIMIKY